MKLTIEKSKLLPAATQAAKLASGKIAASRCVLLETQVQALMLSASDGEISIQCVMPTSVVKLGEASVDAQRFQRIVAACGQSIDLAAKKTTLEIRSAGGRWEVGLDDGQPAMVEEKRGGHVVAPGVVVDAMARVLHASDSDAGSRYALQGVRLERVDHRWRAIATDGRRLSVCGGDRQTAADGEWLVPARLAKTLVSVFAGATDGAIGTGANSIAMTSGEWTVAGRLMEGRFPQWRSVIPTLPHSVSVPAHELRDMLQRVKVCSQEAKIELSIADGALRAAGVDETAQAEAEIVVPADSPALKTSVNADYLLDFFQDAIGSVDIYYGTAEQALVLVDGDHAVGVVMPMTAGVA
jgi:DNA polymerase-3 subunit beta